MTDYVIIVAGGKGLRMGGDLPKQFLPLNGRPVLMHTLERFASISPLTPHLSPLTPHLSPLNIILVLPHEQQAYWRELCKEHHFEVPHTVVDGGETRFHSSQNGLRAIPDDAQGVVAIHDGVRPFVSTEVIARCFEAARQHGAAIPVLPVTDTLRYVGSESASNPPAPEVPYAAAQPQPSHNVLRSDYRIVQTPQAFDIQLLKRAFRQPYSEQFTDDASVVEALGTTVAMVDGNRENIKLTTPFDLTIADVISWSVK